MNLKDFKLLMDENIDPSVVIFLQEEGFDVLDVKEQGWKSHQDADLLNIATLQDRIIVTHDEDFGKLVYVGNQQFLGILYLSPGHFLASFTITTLKTLLTQSLDLIPPFILVAENKGSWIKIRLRNL